MENLTDLIEAWFTAHQEGAFVSGIRECSYSVIGPAGEGGRIIYAIKSRIASAAMYEGEILGDFGMIGRGGLPNREDLDWISQLIGPRPVLFIGDMDPADLMVFAWLRASLRPRSVTFVGVCDAFIDAVEVSSIETLWMPCDRAEQQSLPLLKTILPDVGNVVGTHCMCMLERGLKIELDAFGSNRQNRLAIARYLRGEDRAHSQ